MFRKRADRVRGVAGTLEGRTILIADAVAGAGSGLVRVVAQAGASVLASASDKAMLDVTIASVQAPPRPIATLPAPESLTVSTAERIDDAIINAGPEIAADALSRWTALARDIAATMQDRGHTGSIVFVTGIERTGRAGSIAAFLRSEMEDMAAQLAPNAIRVNAIECGPLGSTRRGQPQSNRATPLGHTTVHPVDVGKAAWFLLNPELSAAITGATIRVDRGAALTRPDW